MDEVLIKLNNLEDANDEDEEEFNKPLYGGPLREDEDVENRAIRIQSIKVHTPKERIYKAKELWRSR